MLVRRPKAPEGFNKEARDVRAKIRRIVLAMAQGGEPPKSDDFDDVWSSFKDKLAEAQNGKCGYCDRHVLGGDDGTIDHYHPKAEITALFDDPATWGRQKTHSASVSGRQEQPVSRVAYHWLAYAWSNYIFACSCCNKKWKRSFFPVARHPRCCPPRPKGQESPLLLHCYQKLRPSEHLQWNADGTVEPRGDSRHGFETIRTVGLHRDPLCVERKAVAEDVFESIQRWADGDAAQQKTAERDLLRLGSDTRPFAGVARAIVEQQLGLPWEDFVGLVAPAAGTA